MRGFWIKKKKIEQQTYSRTPTNYLVKLAVKTKFTTPYACIYIDKTETVFIKMRKFQPLV